MKASTQLFQLDEIAIDEIIDALAEFCQQVGTERKEMFRYRLSAEECLLYWIDHGLRGSRVRLQMGRYMHMPYATLEVEGPSLNPYADGDEDYGGVFAENVLTSLGLSPEYSYVKDCNRIRFRIKKKPPSQIAVLCIVLGVAALIGALGMIVIPEAIRKTILDVVINPIYNTFFRLLGCVAGPMVFLSVAWGVYGIGDAATFSKIGRKLLLKFVFVTFAASVFCAVYFPFLGPTSSSAGSGEGQFAAIAEMLLGIIPANIVEPFLNGNTLQIIFMAVIIGIALLYLGRQTTAIAKAIDQINILVQFLMQFVSKMVPSVIFLVVISVIWSGSLEVFSTSWKLFISLLSAMLLITLVMVAVTCARLKVRPLVLIRKNVPTFLLSLATASSTAAFNTSTDSCEKKLGIDGSVVKFGIPSGWSYRNP